MGELGFDNYVVDNFVFFDTLVPAMKVWLLGLKFVEDTVVLFAMRGVGGVKSPSLPT